MSPRANNREALLEGAIHCLQERGYADTRARDIVAAAGANLASIGYHFGSTEQLLAEALAESLRRWLEEFARLFASGQRGSSRKRLERAAGGFLQSLEHNRGLALAFVEALARAPRSEPLRQTLAASYEQGRFAVLSMFDAGDDPAGMALASMLIAIFDGLLVQWLLDPQSVPNGRLLMRAIERLDRLTG